VERPGASFVGSIVVHAVVVGAVVASLFFGIGGKPPAKMINAVPVQIVSETMVLGAPADNPSEELVAEDASSAPVETVPEPTPPPPEPTPPRPTPPRPPEKAATPRPTPRPPVARPPRPTPPPPTPRPPAPRPQPGLNLDDLAGPPRPGPRRPNPPPTGGGATGTAPQTSGPVVTAMFEQVYDNWNVFVTCDMEGGADLRIQMDVTLSPTGRITSGPTLVGARNSEVYRAAAAEAMRALRATAPFDVPAGFTGGTYRPTFLTARMCRGR
jgi:outer membrane biosynthesis protein TonB